MNNKQLIEYPTIKLIGVPLTLCDKDQLLSAIKTIIMRDHKGLILSGNIHSFNLAYQNQWLLDLFYQADIVRIDGAGLRLGVKLLGKEAPRRMTWADFAWDLAGFCAEKEFSLFLLGGAPGIAQLAANRLVDVYPNLNVVGADHGYFDKTVLSTENETMIHKINQAKPHILIVGFGMPLQEKWLNENRHKIEANVIMTGGAVFDYVSGELRRAPNWLTDSGLEWFGRMMIEPRRLWRRYILGNPLFFWRVLKQKFGLLDVQ